MKLLISTGEVSGDLQGSLLINALKTNAEKRKIELEIIALGGEFFGSSTRWGTPGARNAEWSW